MHRCAGQVSLREEMIDGARFFISKTKVCGVEKRVSDERGPLDYGEGAQMTWPLCLRNSWNGFHHNILRVIRRLKRALCYSNLGNNQGWRTAKHLYRNKGLRDKQTNRNRKGHQREIPDKNLSPLLFHCAFDCPTTIQWLLAGLVLTGAYSTSSL